MNGTTLVLLTPPALRLDLRGLLPHALAAVDDAALARWPVGCGHDRVALGELCRITRFDADEPTLRLEGDFSRADRIGWGQAGGQLLVEGDAGDHAGALMTAGALHIRGSAGLLAGCQMAGGRLAVAGNVGDHAASGLPGSMDGMRGGVFTVAGNAGARLADRMRRGTLWVQGDAGDFMASRLVAGTLVLGGRCGVHPGWGQRRGSIVLLQGQHAQQGQAGQGAFQPPPTFVPANAEARVAWQLLARDLAKLDPLLADLPRRTVQRWLGDLAVDGRGEMILAT